MKTTHRNYSEAAGDFNLLCRFMVQDHAYIRAHSTWCLGRMVDWKYGLYESKLSFADFTGQNAHLWFDALGELAGLAIAENGDAEFTIITARGYRFLYKEILQWVLEAWKGRGPRVTTEITALQAAEAAVLERFGFHRRASFYTRHFDLTGELVARFPLEPGFTIVDMATHPDFRAQRTLRANGFHGTTSLSEEEMQLQLKFDNYGHQGPIYHPDTDLCVMAPDGRFVAGCEALIDARNEEADIERVCTHSEFRRRGFARAAIQECLYRLKEMGLRSAYITGYSPAAIALYGSLGAVGETESFVYEQAAV